MHIYFIQLLAVPYSYPSSSCVLRGKAPSHLALNSNDPRGWLIWLGTHAHPIVSHSFEPMTGARGMSCGVCPDLDYPVATWLHALIDSSTRTKIRVGKWMGEEQFPKGRKVVTGKQKRQLSPETRILLSFGRMTQSPQIWSSFGELKTESFWNY